MVLLASKIMFCVPQNGLSSSAIVDAYYGSCTCNVYAVCVYAVEYEVVFWEGCSKIRQEMKRYWEIMVIAPHTWLSGCKTSSKHTEDVKHLGKEPACSRFFARQFRQNKTSKTVKTGSEGDLDVGCTCILVWGKREGGCCPGDWAVSGESLSDGFELSSKESIAERGPLISTRSRQIQLCSSRHEDHFRR